MKHTPGPWKVGTIMEGLLAGTVVVTGKNGNSVNSFGTGSDPECAANAYLIAAAPDMYECIKLHCDQCLIELENDICQVEECAFYKALKKAEGKGE